VANRDFVVFACGHMT